MEVQRAYAADIGSRCAISAPECTRRACHARLRHVSPAQLLTASPSMTDPFSRLTNGSDGGQPQELRVQILGQYVKDLSFETPGAPTNMANRPQIEMGVDLQSRGLDQDRYEVNLKLRITAKGEDRP